MTFRTFFEKQIRGWFPQEPKLPQTLLNRASPPAAPYLKFTTPLKIVYAVTLGVVAYWLLGTGIQYFWDESSVSLLFTYLYMLPGLFYLNVLPLSIFSVVFLTKGGGTNYFRSWKAGKKLQVAGYTILAGYITVMLPHLLKISAFLPRWPIQGRFERVAEASSIFIFIGLGLMFFGFGYLVLLHKWSASFNKETVTSEQTTYSKKNATKKIIGLVFVILVLSVSLVCLAGAHYTLQRKYDSLSGSLEHMRTFNVRLVDEQWTDYPSNASKYVNYRVGVLNIGYGKSYNVTVLVNVYGSDNTVLKHEEIYVGDLTYSQYEQVDVNINYSGEFSRISSGYSFD